MNQLGANLITINDYLTIFDNDSTQSIIIPSNHIYLPLHSHGPVPFISIYYPTDEERDTCQRIYLMAKKARI